MKTKLTIEDIRNPARKSGFDHVNRANGAAPRKALWRARLVGTSRKGATNIKFTGPIRETPEEAAQDYCDYINGLGDSVPSVVLNSHGHVRESVRRARNEEVAALNARLKEIEDEQNSASDHPGYVYLIGEQGRDEFYKVGHARTSAQNRMIGMQTSNGRTFVLIATIEGSPDDEKALHAKYIHNNHAGEWFYGSNELFAEFDADYDEWKASVTHITYEVGTQTGRLSCSEPNLSTI